MKNKELKEALIGDKTFQEYKRRFRHWDLFAEHGISCKEFYEVKDGLDPIEWKSLEELRINEKRRKRNCRDRIIRMLSHGRVLFITLTFDNDTLSRTNEKTRRVYVARWLKQSFSDYVANVDFGDLNGREHYHAVVQEGLMCPMPWDYGFCDFERVYVESSKHLTDYINKLTAHAVKRSTDPLGHRLIYARAL